LFEDAVIRGKTLLRRYGLDAIGVHGLLSRGAGIQILEKAVLAVQTSADEKVEFGMRALDPQLFQEERQADRSNRQVVNLLAAGLVNESDSDRRSRWIKYLGSVLLRSFSNDAEIDRKVKESLVRGVDRTRWERVKVLLTESSGSSDIQTLKMELLTVWLFGV